MLIASPPPPERWRTLADWLIAPPSERRPVAAGCDERAFRARVAGWIAGLAPYAARPVALHVDDTVDFAAALLAALQLACEVALPGDALPATVARLRDDVAAFAGDFPGTPVRALPADPATAFVALDPQPASLLVHTSGSTGDPVAIVKRLHQLQAEVDALEQCFGARLGDAAIHATVSHQHIYGLLFRVLWPLCAGRAMTAQRLAYPEQIAAALGGGDAALVASPAHLSRLPDSLDGIGAVAVFSSGGALTSVAARHAARVLGRAAIEVYGSSETGGIAWRERTDDDARWQPLPGVAIAVDHDALSIRSPFLPDAEPFRCSDRVELLADGGFRLLGRADRIVKIEERRVSLDAIERALRALDGVRDARVVVLPDARTVLGAVVVLDRAAPADASERRALSQRFRAVLAERIERVCLPRRWRYVDALPSDARGKTTDAALQALFRPERPEPQWYERSDDRVLGTVELTPDLLPFDGHFDAAPVLPGVAMIDWAIRWAGDCFGLMGTFARMERVKFQRLARPGMLLHVELAVDRDAGTLDYGFRSTEGPHAGGRIVFERTSG